MQQSIEKQQEAKSVKNFVTAMFHGSNASLAVIGSLGICGRAARSMSGGLARASLAPPQPHYQNVFELNESVRHRARKQTHQMRMQAPELTEKCYAEEPLVPSALAVLATHSNKCGSQAGSTEIIKNIEQRRCFAA